MSDDLRMDAYYYGFVFTSAQEIDLILSAVACAGKAYHHTEDWKDETNPWTGHEGRTPVDWIQNAAGKAATEITRLRERVAELEAREVRYQEALESYEAEIATFNERYASLEARTAELENESAALRTIVSKCADALGNGAAISYDCSIAFMGELPSEIGLHVASLTEDRDTWKSRAQQFQRERAELSDKLNGTPCAEIRWQYERASFREAMAEAKDALASLLDCPEISDADPRDKDHETHAAERKASAALAKLRSVMK